MCMPKKRITVAALAGEFVGMLIRLSKSITFNIVLFIAGIAVGYVITATSVHINSMRNDNYECISILEKHLHEQRVLDDLIDSEIKNLKLKISHDQFAPCRTKYSYFLPKAER